MPASLILLIDDDKASAAAIGATLSKVGYTLTTVPDADAAFPLVADHQLVIIDVNKSARSAPDISREIRATPAMTGIPILCIGQSDDVEERIRFLEAGADDVIAKPFDSRELEARVEALLLRFQRSKDLASVVSADGLTMGKARRMVVVHSPKGGVGTTTIATNIAIAQARQRPERVVLIDLSLQFGQAATHLNMDVRQSIADVVRDDAALREPELLRTYAMRHNSGLHVLASPPSPELSDLITAQHIDQLLQTALEVWDGVVVDAGSWLDDRTITALDRAETIIFPVNRDISTLKALHALLDYLNETGTVGERAAFVLNNQFARETLRLRDVESALGAKVAIELPYDAFLYLKAINEGVPIVMGAPRSPAAEQLQKLASTAFGANGLVPAAAMETDAVRKQGLLGAFRRH